MNKSLQDKLIRIAKEKQTKDDPTHDFEHVKRVYNMAMIIAEKEKADLDVVVPAALFHDIIVYKKDSPKSKFETDESAEVTGDILKATVGYQKNKIEAVKRCIKECSFSKALEPSSLESSVLQDADLLESTGVISIIRTFSSCGHMNRAFYNPEKPFSERIDKEYPSGLGLFYRRLLIADTRMHSKYAKKLAKKRTKFLITFLDELKRELKETKII
jgi:uncharacterized protein